MYPRPMDVACAGVPAGRRIRRLVRGEARDDRLLEAELRLVHVREVEADAGVGDHGADGGVVVGDGDVRLGDARVPPDVLQALREREEEGVEDVARQQDLTGAVPAHLEAHPPEALLHRLQRVAEHRLLHGLQRVAARRLRGGVRAQAELPEEARVVGRLLAHGLRGDADSGVREEGEGRQHGVVQEPGALASLGLELARHALGAVGAPDVGDAATDPVHGDAQPVAEDPGEHPAEHVHEHDVGEGGGGPGGADRDDAGEHEGGRHDAEPARSDGLQESERPDGAHGDVRERGERRRGAPAELRDDHRREAGDEHHDHPPDARVGPDPPLGDGEHGQERDAAGRGGHGDLARQQDARGGDRGEAEAVDACGPLQQALAFALHAIHRVPARSAPTPVACARCASDPRRVRHAPGTPTSPRGTIVHMS
jgi:hypothetical protein